MRKGGRGHEVEKAIGDEIHPSIGRRAGIPETDLLRNAWIVQGNRGAHPIQFSLGSGCIGWWRHAKILARRDYPGFPTSGLGLHELVDRLCERGMRGREDHYDEKTAGKRGHE
jgi:hypothetical protein